MYNKTLNEKLIASIAEEDLIQILVCMADCLLQNKQLKTPGATLEEVNSTDSNGVTLQNDNLQKSGYK